MARPSKLNQVVHRRTRRQQDGTEVAEDVTAADAIVERLAAGAYREEAARSVGISKQTLYNWLWLGAHARQRQATGDHPTAAERRTRRLPSAADDARYLAFLDAVEQAEANALLTDWTRLGTMAAGGIPTTTIREKVERVPDPAAPGGFREVVTERTTTTSHTLPDVRALTWRLERRYPKLFGYRVELTGKEGGPIEVDDTRARARALADELRAYQQGIIDTTAQEVTRGQGEGEAGG